MMRSTIIFKHEGLIHSEKSHKIFLDHLGKKLGFHKPEDWYVLQHKDIDQNNGRFLLKIYKSIPQLIQANYPNHQWLPWKFSRVYQGFWDNKKNQRNYLDWLGIQLGFTDLNDWYRIFHQDIVDYGGIGILTKYDGSPSKMLQSVYPEHNWNIYKFDKVPYGHWESMENQKKFMDWLGVELGVTEMQDWYKITQKEMEDKGASGLLSQYRDSPSRLLKVVYSDHNWELWRFPIGTWTELQPEMRIELTLWLHRQLKIKDLDDWYRISQEQLNKYISLRTFKKYPLKQLLKETFPLWSWDVKQFKEKGIHC